MQPWRKPMASKKLLRSPQSVQRRGRERWSRQQRLHGAETKRTRVCIALSLYIMHATPAMLTIRQPIGPLGTQPVDHHQGTHILVADQDPSVCPVQYSLTLFNTIPVYRTGHSCHIEGHDPMRESCPTERCSSTSSACCCIIFREPFICIVHSGDPIFSLGFEELIAAVVGICTKEANTREGSLPARPS